MLGRRGWRNKWTGLQLQLLLVSQDVFISIHILEADVPSPTVASPEVSLVPIVLHLLFYIPVYCCFLTVICSLPIIPGSNVLLTDWLACWHRCLWSTFLKWFNLFPAVLHLQRDYYGCKSECLDVDTFCMWRWWPAELHPPSDLTLDRSVCSARGSWYYGRGFCALWGITTVAVDQSSIFIRFCVSICTHLSSVWIQLSICG